MGTGHAVKQEDDHMRLRFERILIDLTMVFTGLAGVVTLGYYRPTWSCRVTAWSLKRRCAARAKK